MSYTVNCIVCAQNAKRSPAAMWTGYVLMVSDDKKENVIAGFCKKHEHLRNSMEHKKELSRHKWCFGLWNPDMGVDRSYGPLFKD